MYAKGGRRVLVRTWVLGAGVGRILSILPSWPPDSGSEPRCVRGPVVTRWEVAVGYGYSLLAL